MRERVGRELDARPAVARSAGRVGGHQSRSSFPVRLMKTVSRLGSATERSATSKPPLSAAVTTRGTSRSAPLHVQLDAAVDRRGCGSTPSISLCQPLGQRGAVAGGLDRDDGVGADRPLERGRRVEGEDPAVVHDRHPVAELVGLLHVVGGEQDRLAVAR